MVFFCWSCLALGLCFISLHECVVPISKCFVHSTEILGKPSKPRPVLEPSPKIVITVLYLIFIHQWFIYYVRELVINLRGIFYNYVPHFWTLTRWLGFTIWQAHFYFLDIFLTKRVKIFPKIIDFNGFSPQVNFFFLSIIVTPHVLSNCPQILSVAIPI